MPDFDNIAAQIADALGKPFKIHAVQSLSGGDINQAYCIASQEQRYFVKINRLDLSSMFHAEREALLELADSHSVRVPRPICCGQTATQAFLVLEYIHLQAKNRQAEQLLGEQLAKLHQRPQAFFGWHQDNTLGSTPQINTPIADWISFWQQNRLEHQLQLAQQQGYRGKLPELGAHLAQVLPQFFQGYAVQASLLHGDLWGGNAAADANGLPVIFDPASYYGDRETDIAMTELFGGFGPEFYAAYQHCLPLDPGYKTRKQLYNLYHILNHLNLFGSGYLSQAERIMQNLLAELR